MTGNQVEKYTLTALYSPDYDVLPKGQLSAEETLTGTEFILYRSAREGDDQSKITTIPGVEGNFYPEKTLVMTESTALISDIEALQEGEEYYLVETKAPDGYNTLTEAIPVILTFTENYTPKPETEVVNVKPATQIYDWEEDVALTLTLPEWVTKTGEDGNIVSYDVRNDAGAELPSAGGFGAKWYYLFGACLIAFAIVIALRNKRHKKVQSVHKPIKNGRNVCLKSTINYVI